MESTPIVVCVNLITIAYRPTLLQNVYYSRVIAVYQNNRRLKTFNLGLAVIAIYTKQWDGQWPTARRRRIAHSVGITSNTNRKQLYGLFITANLVGSILL